MTAGKPVWRSATFLLYVGGLTVLFASLYELEYLRGSYQEAAFVGWSALVLVALVWFAALLRWNGKWVAAGVFAVSAVVAWGVFVGSIFAWWGWLPGGSTLTFSGFHAGRLLVLLLVLGAAVAAIRVFEFPLLVLVACIAAWLFLGDLLSNGGNWSALVSLLIGLGFFWIGIVLDRGPRRVYGFWVGVAAGLTVGGSLVFYWHHGDAKWALVALGGIGFVALARVTARSSWAVLGAIGLFLAAGHFAISWGHVDLLIFDDESEPTRRWVAPLVFLALGLLYVLLGLMLDRGRREEAEPVSDA